MGKLHYIEGRSKIRARCGIKSKYVTCSPYSFWSNKDKCGRCANIITVGNKLQPSNYGKIA